MSVVFLIYCSFFVLFVLLQLVYYPYFITVYLSSVMLSYFFSLSLGLY